MLIPYDPLQVSVTEPINQAIGDAIESLPTLVGATIILIVEYIVGRVLGRIVRRVITRIGIDRYTEGTAVEEVGSGDGLARVLGMIVAYYVYFVAIIAAANVLNIPQLTDLLADLGAFLPVVLGALTVLDVGFVAGRIIGDPMAGVAVTVFIYYITVTLALALTPGIGLAVSLGGQDYVTQNIDDWVTTARGTVTEADEPAEE